MSYTTKYYTADLHLGHARILDMLPATRPFASVEEMDAAIIGGINARVRQDDILYILGDFALSRDPEYVRHLFHSIRGRKILITGNHDLDNKGRLAKPIRDLPWHIQPVAGLETKDGGARIYMHHYACRTWPAQLYHSYHLYGHSHGALPAQGRSRDVGIDCPDLRFAPATFAELQETLV